MKNVNYETFDLVEASVLKYYSQKLECINKTQKRAVFSFIKDDQTDQLLKSYWERVLQVEPYAFSQCMRDVKDRLYNG
mgnify:FL=1|jgi:hypothetical protein